MLSKDVGNVNPDVSTKINHERRAIVQLGTVYQLACVVDLSPWSLPCCHGLHVAVESLEVSGAFLASPKEVEAVWVTV